MPSRTRISLYIAFLVALGIWSGSGVYDTIRSHPGWWSDPVAWVRAPVAPQEALSLNPWPFTTMLLALCTLAGLAAFARYRGLGRREVLVVLGSVFVILVATGLYFVPTLVRLGDHAALTDAQITSMSYRWMQLNLLRNVVLQALIVYGLVGLMRLAQARVGAARGPGVPASAPAGASAAPAHAAARA
jgi:hypothetical protein